MILLFILYFSCHILRSSYFFKSFFFLNPVFQWYKLLRKINWKKIGFSIEIRTCKVISEFLSHQNSESQSYNNNKKKNPIDKKHCVTNRATWFTNRATCVSQTGSLLDVTNHYVHLFSFVHLFGIFVKSYMLMQITREIINIFQSDFKQFLKMPGFRMSSFFIKKYFSCQKFQCGTKNLFFFLFCYFFEVFLQFF